MQLISRYQRDLNAALGQSSTLSFPSFCFFFDDNPQWDLIFGVLLKLCVRDYHARAIKSGRM